MPSTDRPLRLVVTGREGQVARGLLERGPAQGVEVVALGRPTLDLADPATLHGALADARPDVIVNAAAYTAVDKAESEPDAAFTVNAAGAGAVATVAASLGVPVVHLSTDYVFSGEGDRPWREDDATGPLGVYGRSKLAGEAAVAKAARDHAILRTAWVYSPFGANFVKTMLRVGATRDELGVVADQHGSPTSALDIADGCLRVARNLVERPSEAALRGVFHMTGQGFTTWAAFAEAVFAVSQAVGGPTARVKPIGTADYPTPARRPGNSRLDCHRIAAVHGVRLPAWESAVATCVGRLLKEKRA